MKCNGFSRMLACFLSLCVVGGVASCSVKTDMFTVNDIESNIIDDKYRTYYEVFVYSFYDSDGDGIGDLNGLDSKLDYINELGCNGIWLMPVMPSPTYHKYDVTDYYDIDPQYGSLEDFDRLIEDCDARGINVIIDLVLNHTSSEHPWFTTAYSYVEALPEGEDIDTDVCPEAGYYNFSRQQSGGFYPVGDSGWYYEAQFWSEMPDLNLMNQDVRDEIENIVAFWIDRGVDGFRLDATTYYVSGGTDSNIEILSWINDTVKASNPDAYIVGEAWTDQSTYAKYYQSGVDSFFNFRFAGKDGVISKVAGGTATTGAAGYGQALVSLYDEISAYDPYFIDAPFFTNHDIGRAAGFFPGDETGNKIKIAQAMNLLMSGNTFVYYGEELGMRGAGIDENKRLPMYWSDDASAPGMCAGPVDADSRDMKYPSFEEQEEDQYSIYNYVKQTIALRNVYPEIARGRVTFLENLSDHDICVLRKTFDDEEITIVFNISPDAHTVELDGDYELAGVLQVDENNVAIQGSSYELPGYCIILLK